MLAQLQNPDIIDTSQQGNNDDQKRIFRCTGFCGLHCTAFCVILCFCDETLNP